MSKYKKEVRIDVCPFTKCRQSRRQISEIFYSGLGQPVDGLLPI